jgi:acid phosphatase (class A)
MQNNLSFGFKVVVLTGCLIAFQKADASHVETVKSLFENPLFRKTVDPFDGMNGSSTTSKPEIDVLRFKESDWVEFFLKYRARTPIYIPDWQQQIVLPPPPANTSARTRAELDDMLHLQSKRTPRHKAAIDKEANADLYALGWLLNDAFEPKKMTATGRLLERALQDVLTIHLCLKQKFSRVRPHILEPKLKPCIDVPPYPAYPSGHSTHMHTLAFIFQELRPEGAAIFQREAFRVAWDRELAGLHFTSDTAAGRLLARQIVDLLMTKKAFIEDLENARKEWEQMNIQMRK